MTLHRRASSPSTPSEPEIQWPFKHAELVEAAEELFRAERCLIQAGIFGERNRAMERASFPAVLSNFPKGSPEEQAETVAVEHLKRAGDAMARLCMVCPGCGEHWRKELFDYVMSAVIYCESPSLEDRIH